MPSHFFEFRSLGRGGGAAPRKSRKSREDFQLPRRAENEPRGAGRPSVAQTFTRRLLRSFPSPDPASWSPGQSTAEPREPVLLHLLPRAILKRTAAAQPSQRHSDRRESSNPTFAHADAALCSSEAHAGGRRARNRRSRGRHEIRRRPRRWWSLKGRDVAHSAR